MQITAAKNYGQKKKVTATSVKLISAVYDSYVYVYILVKVSQVR